MKTFSYHRINRLLLSLLHEILTIGGILKIRKEDRRCEGKEIPCFRYNNSSKKHGSVREDRIDSSHGT